MWWIAWTVLFGIAFWSCVGAAALGSDTHKDGTPGGYGNEKFPVRSAGIGGAVAVAIAWLVVSSIFMIHTVGQRQVGIVYNFAGTITGKKDPGVVTTWPWEHVKKENVGIQHFEFEFLEGNSAVSKDQQPIFARLSTNLQINSENVVDLYKRVGAGWKEIIVKPRVPQVFKETTASYATPDITAKREQLRRDVRARLTDELDQYDIDVVDVFVTNIGFSDSYSDAIEAKQKQVQDALRQEAKIREAKAIGDQKVATAQRNAQANIAEARGEATANKLRQKSLTKLLIQQQAIEKLNPQATIIFCPTGTTCIPNAGVVPTGSNP